MLAYSSVSHMGYMLVGFGVAVGYGIANGAAGGPLPPDESRG